MSESPVHDEAWLLRHHVTLVVQWAVQSLGRAVLVASLVSGLSGIVGLISGDGGWFVAAPFLWVLVFGFVLWTASAPFPIVLPDDD